jgi:phosphatidylinositol transfer protein SFH5
MELGIEKLDLKAAKTPIPNYGEGPDPYQGIQIHDYMNTSFLRPDPNTRAASKKAIEVFQSYYPETLSKKFFVNVPLVMQWMFTFIKPFVSVETQKKWAVLSYGNQLAKDVGPDIPKEYGGEKGPITEIGTTVKLD